MLQKKEIRNEMVDHPKQRDDSLLGHFAVWSNQVVLYFLWSMNSPERL
jgi:hypothetical protein